MKNLTTPRTLADAQFDLSRDPVYPLPVARDPITEFGHRLIPWAAAFAGIAAIAIVLL